MRRCYCSVERHRALGNAAATDPFGEKAKVTGTILFEDTKIERHKGKWEFCRHPRMDVTAMVPGLKIEAEGVCDCAQGTPGLGMKAFS